jgi:phenylpropionate dioxygenase-like ring-hydroxylating dioxygenase large terminal subunit
MRAEALIGTLVDTAQPSSDINFSQFDMQIATAEYHDPAHQAMERDRLWMRTWQIVCRTDDLAAPGDWIEFRRFDQSYIIVRGKDAVARGFVNACRHRGSMLCKGKGHAPLLTCPYHNWTYGLDGALIAVARPDYSGSLEDFVGSKSGLGLVPVAVASFGGFLFLNPDPAATPLATFLGPAADILAMYRLDEMVPVRINVRETLHCNWKVVMDAFQEGYHVQGVHPELVSMTNMSRERCRFFGDHAVTVVPFDSGDQRASAIEEEVDRYLGMPPEKFTGPAEALPRLAAIRDRYRRADGVFAPPEGATAVSLLQSAMRELLTEKGLDVSGLTDNQMSDNQYWLLFPNVFLQVRAGNALVITAEPHESGDPNRCCWSIMVLRWLKADKRVTARVAQTVVPEGEHAQYFLALEQDYQQMCRQQSGLRNRALSHQRLTRYEPKVAFFHHVLKRWLSTGDEASSLSL